MRGVGVTLQILRQNEGSMFHNHSKLWGVFRSVCPSFVSHEIIENFSTRIKFVLPAIMRTTLSWPL